MRDECINNIRLFVHLSIIDCSKFYKIHNKKNEFVYIYNFLIERFIHEQCIKMILPEF